VPIDGKIKEMALIVKGREQSQLIDPDHPEAGLIVWEGQWRQLDRAWEFDPQWGNFVKAWNTINFPRLLGNTLMYASITTFGAVLSASLVAYGFARFRIPKKNIFLTDWMGRYLATADCAGFLCMGHQCVFAQAIYYVDPA
jgi:multiple sugar transport system permease protein